MKKINIAELLKDCPKGMELDCAMYDNAYFEQVDEKAVYPIVINIGNTNTISLTKEGHWNKFPNAKCVIFPKGKTTWEGFVPPHQFKDGDILSYQYKGFKNRTIFIYMYHSRMNTTYYAALSGGTDSEFMINDKKGHALNSYNDTVRLATEEEKAKLFQAIKDNGYRWNAETKTLEKLIEPKFKVGDKIKKKNSDNVHILEITAITPKTYIFRDGSFQYVEIVDKDYELINEPKFKVGDRVKHISAYTSGIVIKVVDKGYYIDYPTDGGIRYISFSLEKDYELVPNKFDITALVPFESKVLVRNDINQLWIPAFWGYKRDNGYATTFGWCQYCIPYEGNQHLLGTTNDYDDFYKTWEK